MMNKEERKQSLRLILEVLFVLAVVIIVFLLVVLLSYPAPQPLAGPVPEASLDYIYDKTPRSVNVIESMEPKVFLDDFYQLQGERKGMTLVLNVTEYADKTRNPVGAEVDARNMNELYSKLGYTVYTRQGSITKDEFETTIRSFLVEAAIQKPQSVTVFLGGHGECGFVETTDGHSVKISDIVHEFNMKAELDGIPKFFLLGPCQSKRINAITLFSRSFRDTVLLLSAPPGQPSRFKPNAGSWFIHCFTKVVMNNAFEDDFKTIVGKVQSAMARIGFSQVCVPIYFHFKKFYFNVNV